MAAIYHPALSLCESGDGQRRGVDSQAIDLAALSAGQGPDGKHMGSGVLTRISLAAFQRAAASISVQLAEEGGGGGPKSLTAPNRPRDVVIDSA